MAHPPLRGLSTVFGKVRGTEDANRKWVSSGVGVLRAAFPQVVGDRTTELSPNT